MVYKYLFKIRLQIGLRGCEMTRLIELVEMAVFFRSRILTLSLSRIPALSLSRVLVTSMFRIQYLDLICSFTYSFVFVKCQGEAVMSVASFVMHGLDVLPCQHYA